MFVLIFALPQASHSDRDLAYNPRFLAKICNSGNFVPDLLFMMSCFFLKKIIAKFALALLPGLLFVITPYVYWILDSMNSQPISPITAHRD